MKQKTRKAVKKKFTLTKTGKVVRRHTKQNHGNAKETGQLRRKKRSDKIVKDVDKANVLRALPYA
jgi:ribosomal protein L35